MFHSGENTLQNEVEARVEIRPFGLLQLAIHVVQSLRAEEQKSHSDKVNKRHK